MWQRGRRPMNLLRRRRELIDDRGQATVLYISRRPMPRPPQGDASRGRALSRRLMRVMFGPYYLYVAAMVIYGIGVGLVLPWLMLPVLHWSRDAGLPVITVGVAMGFVLGAALFGGPLWWYVGRRRRHIRDAALACTFCPSCLYDLQALTAQADGCTVCSECGAAWRLVAETEAPMRSDSPRGHRRAAIG